ncbi:aminoglycoside phosphotransferase family protein [Kribbella sp. VKM Ac-2568]|uniref:aminoglycoside phosphotransferase family protein n=1 Tax=Kribbella sp. VKM Ac-2568 TaxID=2512219 RepID=UPI001044533F|nr:aminoglycoside phosphotransferase family protein [Kribbella sp. VKM Ac-2568]TCM49323.1 streptomycin 6-kinase [Kribbella sp. VKM Ac-2568]
MIELPQTFLDMPRWWTDGKAWLEGLPAAVQAQCEAWNLQVDGELAHGSNAIAVPVERDGESLILRMSPPGAEVLDQVRALQWWDGRGTVRLYDADAGRGAMLLERLGEPLSTRPVGEAVAVMGRLMRRLAVPAPADAHSTAQIAADRGAQLEDQWNALGRPFDQRFLAAALEVAPALARSTAESAVNGDLHADQVLRGTREAWLAVDPVLYRGDIEHDLARILWTRVDEMADAAEIVGHFDTVVSEAVLDREYARDWVVFRTVDYWLWGLNVGLTEDPPRCQRVLTAFLD